MTWAVERLCITNASAYVGLYLGADLTVLTAVVYIKLVTKQVLNNPAAA